MDEERMSDATRKRWQEKRKRDGEKFLCGPVPLPWLKRAAILPGKAFTVGVALWYLRGMVRDDSLTFCTGTWDQFGLERRSVYRGLKQLESAGLITVARHRGRCPVVTIREVEKRKSR